MKSEHRHELETNQLSANLAKGIEGVKPFTGQIVTGVVLLVVLYAGISIWNSNSEQLEREAWDAYALAIDTSDPELDGLQRVASDTQYSGTKMQEWAYMGWADRQVLQAMSSYLIDRDVTKERLRSVLGIYEELSSNATDPQIRNRARFGLACVYELQDKLDDAREQYLLVRGDLQTLAAERAAQLESDEVRADTTWLASAELPKRDLTGGQGASGFRPEFNADLPSTGSTGDSVTPDTLKEMLGDFSTEGTSGNRYGEQDNAEGSTTEDTPSDNPTDGDDNSTSQE